MALSDEIERLAGRRLAQLELNTAEQRYWADNRTLPDLTPVGLPAFLDQDFREYRHRNTDDPQDETDKPSRGLELATELVNTKIIGNIPNNATHYLLGPSRTIYLSEEEGTTYSVQTRPIMFFEGKVTAINDYFV
jgi:hypothetical protein